MPRLYDKRIKISVLGIEFEEYADRCLDWMVSIVIELAKHPTKGMVIDPKRGLRRWPLDGHNYLTFSITRDGIVVKNILPYQLNKKGF